MLYISLAIILVVAYALFAEGLHNGMLMCLNVLLAGIVTFNFYEPLADALEGALRRSFLAGYEDFLAMVVLYAITLGILRAVSNNFCSTMVEFPGHVQQIGAATFGALTGYFAAGFLICAMQTLPWHENFLGFEPHVGENTGLASIMPPDRVFLAMMRHAGAVPLSWKTAEEDADNRYDRSKTFDRSATFELRYQRYRRFGDNRPPVKYQGELEADMDLK